MSFFDAQDVQRFEAVGHKAMRLANGKAAFPRGFAIPGGHGNFIGQLSREADAENAGREGAEFRLAHAHEREALVGEIQLREQVLQDGAAVWSGNGHGSPFVGDGRDLHVEFGPMDLKMQLQMLHHRTGLCRGCRHVIVVLADPRSGAVIKSNTVLAQHDAVPRLADCQGLPAVDIDPVQQFRRVRSLNIDLAEGRDIGDPGGITHRQRLPLDGFEHRVTGIGLILAKVILRPHPEPGFHHLRTMREMPVMHRRAPYRILVAADLASGEGADGDRCVGRPERGGADLGDVETAGFGKNTVAVDVRGLALIRAHAERGVAFQVLDRDIAFALGQLDVIRRDIVLQINKAPAFAAGQRRNLPEDLERADCLLVGGRDIRHSFSREAKCLCGLLACRIPVGKAVSKAEPATRGAD